MKNLPPSNISGTTPQRNGTDRHVLIRLLPNHHSYTFTHLVDVLTQVTNFHSFSQGNMYPVYLTGDVSPPITQESTWFTLTVTTPTLKQHPFPNLFDSEMVPQYTLTEGTGTRNTPSSDFRYYNDG